MEMQIDDFKKLCKGPANGGYFEYTAKVVKGRAPTHHGMGGLNCQRVITDWFPAGETFELLGSSCFSKGANRDNMCLPVLEVLAKGRDGNIQNMYFTVREVLSIAKQISVDKINRLNRGLPE